MEPVHDHTADERPEQRADERGDDDVVHRREEFRTWESPHEREAADRRHHRAAHALQDARSSEDGDVGRDAAEQRTEHEERDRELEHLSRAEAVGHPATDRNEHGEAQRVARQHALQAERRDVEVQRHRGHGGVHDGRVEVLHEQRDRDEPRHVALGLRGDGDGSGGKRGRHQSTANNGCSRRKRGRRVGIALPATGADIAMRLP